MWKVESDSVLRSQCHKGTNCAWAIASIDACRLKCLRLLLTCTIEKRERKDSTPAKKAACIKERLEGRKRQQQEEGKWCASGLMLRQVEEELEKQKGGGKKPGGQ
eukprot:scaffold74902_cov17-Tisochrysis_lutea.AAC.3